MVAVAWADPVVEAVVATTATGNAASQRVLEKAGFRRAGQDGDGELRYRLPRPG
jgi:RimJ/RimL family protein N-acetyltransferase